MSDDFVLVCVVGHSTIQLTSISDYPKTGWAQVYGNWFCPYHGSQLKNPISLAGDVITDWLKPGTPIDCSAMDSLFCKNTLEVQRKPNEDHFIHVCHESYNKEYHPRLDKCFVCGFEWKVGRL